MSFARFWDTDIYMFEHVGGFIQCCGCWFSGDWVNESVDFPEFKTPREALAHLDVHENAGHDIGRARERIIAEYPDLDITIEPYKQDPEVLERIRQKIYDAINQHPPQDFRDMSNGE